MLGDLLSFDPRTAAWTNLTAATGAGPSPRFGHSLAADGVGGLLLFGGAAAPGGASLAGGATRAVACYAVMLDRRCCWRFSPVPHSAQKARWHTGRIGCSQAQQSLQFSYSITRVSGIGFALLSMKMSTCCWLNDGTDETPRATRHPHAARLGWPARPRPGPQQATTHRPGPPAPAATGQACLADAYSFNVTARRWALLPGGGGGSGNAAGPSPRFGQGLVVAGEAFLFGGSPCGAQTGAAARVLKSCSRCG